MSLTHFPSFSASHAQLQKTHAMSNSNNKLFCDNEVEYHLSN